MEYSNDRDKADIFLDMMNAVRRNNIEELENFIKEGQKEGVDINFDISGYDIIIDGNDYFESLLSIAASFGYLDMIKYLEKNGAKETIYGNRQPLLKIAINNNNIKTIKYFLEKGCWYEDILKDIANVMVNRNISELPEYTINFSDKKKNKIKENIVNKKNEDMIIAAENRDIKRMFYLIDNGANIHYKKDLLITKVSYNGDLETLKYLVNNGLDIHTYDNYCLRYATLKNHKSILEFISTI